MMTWGKSPGCSPTTSGASRSMPRKFGPERRRRAEQQEERQPRGVDPPAHPVPVEPVDHQRIVRRQEAVAVDVAGPGPGHEPVGLGAGGQRREPAVAHGIVVGQEPGHRHIGRQQEAERVGLGRAVGGRRREVGLGEAVHGVGAGHRAPMELGGDRAAVVRQVAGELPVAHGEGVVRLALEHVGPCVAPQGRRDPVHLRAVGVAAIAQVAEHVVERAVLQHDQHDGVDPVERAHGTARVPHDRLNLR